MHQRGSPGKALGYAADGLRRQRDFRHKQDGALPLPQRLGDGAQIDLSLATAGDAMEQETDAFLPPQRRQDLFPGFLLVDCQPGRAIGHEIEITQGIAPDLFFAQIKGADLHQLAQH